MVKHAFNKKLGPDASTVAIGTMHEDRAGSPVPVRRCQLCNGMVDGPAVAVRHADAAIISHCRCRSVAIAKA